jgi:GcrA cell cycle regulator
MIWTDEAVEELKKMWDKGMTTGQIAKVLNVTKNSIIGKVHRLCLTARPSPIKKSSNSEKKDTKQTKAEKVEKTEKNEKIEKTEKATKTKAATPKAEKTKETITKTKEEVAKVETPAVEELNIPLVKLDNHTCRWPLGDPRDEDFCFCGKKIKTGQTYCEEHSAIAYVRTTKKI